MKIQNQQIYWLMGFIMECPMTAKGNRMRRRFLDILEQKFEQYKVHRQELLEMYCAKDQDGNFKTRTEAGELLYEIEDRQKYLLEFAELQTEYFYIEEDEQHDEMLKIIGEAFLRQDGLFSGMDAQYLNDVSEEFERYFKKQGINYSQFYLK